MVICRLRPSGWEAVHPVQVGNHNREPAGVRYLSIQGSKYPCSARGNYPDRCARDVAGNWPSFVGWSVSSQPCPSGWRFAASWKVRIPLQGEASVMMTEVCPYCRAPISAADSSLECEGCGTRHHTDCYAENGGCTIFGCSKAPGDEPKVSVSMPELGAVTGSPSAR